MYNDEAEMECATWKKKIEPTRIQDVLVKKPQMGAAYSRYIKSTIYSPATMYGTLTKETFEGLEPQPLFANIVPSVNELGGVSFVPCKFSDVPKGCVLSYQQKLSTEHIINDFTSTGFPVIPLDSAELGFENNFSGFPLNAKQQAAIESLTVTPETCLESTRRDSDTKLLWYMALTTKEANNSE